MPNFEQACGIELRRLFPCSVLSNILLFRPDVPDHQRYGYEIDHLMHGLEGNLHRLFIIECKEPPVTRDMTGWWVHRANGPSNVRDQVWNHAVALLRHLDGIVPAGALRIEACVLGQNQIAHYTEPSRDPRVNFHCLGVTDFAQFLVKHAEGIQRVHQSYLLNELRLGIALPELGHPEMANGIEFISRCRAAIDNELFQSFPNYPNMSFRGAAAINGTAGMGKSVILAYALFVLASDWFVENDVSNGQRVLKTFSGKAAELKIALHAKRSICAVAMSAKQIETLKTLWERFRELFGAVEGGNALSFNQPVFKQWDGTIPDDCNVLLIDEAHDLNEGAQAIVARWRNDSPDDRYLLIACDRHQKLRLLGRNATMIEGLSFSGHTLRLRRNYRSPFPVYVAGLALMFRWFAKEGPKVIPTDDDMRDGFGFKVEPVSANANIIKLSNINDSHPGNCWSLTVSQFATARDANAMLQREHLRRRDVLWVRFGSEDPTFDYEQLGEFTYHRAGHGESGELLDKYVKGQEFPIVVVEGLPATMLEAELNGNSLGRVQMSEPEREMWRARRELYLCCSRATAFLFFVADQSGSELGGEIGRMLKALSRPLDLSKRCWNFEFKTGTIKRSVKDIDQIADEPATKPFSEGQPVVSPQVMPGHTLPRLKITPPATLEAMLTAYMQATGISSQQATSQVLDTLSRLKADVLFRRDKLSEELVVQLCLSLGVVAEFTAPEVEVSPSLSGPVQEFETQIPESLPKTTGLLGETVNGAAAILGVDKHKLLDALPLTYNENSPLRHNEDIRRMLEKLAKQGITQNGAKLRTFSQAAETANAPATQSPLNSDAGDLTRRLFELIESRRYSEERKAVHHYLWILEVTLKHRPDIRQYLLTLPYQRLHFSTTRESILRNAEYASVFPIGSTGIYAMCTLSNQTKAQLLAEILKKCGIPTAQIARIIQTL